MMLNSNYNAGLWVVILLCCVISGKAVSKVYSWKDKNGDTHYSQFPRKMVEKNVAQSRATLKQARKRTADKDVKKSSEHFLNGLDDIVKTASALKEPEKQLTRVSSQKTLQTDKIKSAPNSVVTPVVEVIPEAVVGSKIKNTATLNRKKIKDNIFLTGIQNKLKRQQKITNSPDVLNDRGEVIRPEPAAISKYATIQPVVVAPNKLKKRKKKHQDDFLTAVNKKRSPVRNKVKLASQESEVKPLQVDGNKTTDAYLAEINRILSISRSTDNRSIGNSPADSSSTDSSSKKLVTPKPE